jgi:hypothetical protein
MNSDIKQRWVDALRSGTYTQGEGRLRTPTGYCCLGVLCDLYDPMNWDGHSYVGEQYTLPDIVSEWADIMNDPYFVSNNSQEYGDAVDLDNPERVYLGSLNDDAKMSFAEIANVIEKEF